MLVLLAPFGKKRLAAALWLLNPFSFMQSISLGSLMLLRLF